MTEIKINIPLRVASKKNNRRNFGRISLPSKAYNNFHSLVREYMHPFRNTKISTSFKLTVFYHIKGKYHQDLDNAVSSVLDCLADYGVITDDELCTEISAKKKNGNKDWLCEVEISEL